MTMKHIAAGLFGIVAAATFAGAAHAQDFPNREIKLVVGFPPGGTTNTLARLLADKMSDALGQRVIVENRAGANGATATRAVARSTADGYTLIFNASNMALNLHGMKEPGYQWDEFVTVGGLAYGPMVLIVNTASSKAKTLNEFIAFGKANPGKLTFASLGPQSIQNVAAQRLQEQSGLGWREVPYKGAGAVLPDLISGQVDGYFTLPVAATQLMNQPNIAVFGVADKTRAELLPNVQTFIEAGYPAVNDMTMAGVWAPAGTPKPVVDRLRAAMAQAMKAPDIKGLVEGTGHLMYQGTPEQFDADIRKQAGQYRDDFKKLGIQPE
jgi:tripartite-type tricarboxylate transporter receptor subunit TctC